jgi:hypothetical protein
VAESPAVSPWPLLAEAVAVTPAPPPAPPPAGGPAVGGERPVSPGLPVPVEPTVAEAAREAPPPAPLQLTVPVPGPAGAPIPLTREVAPPELPPPDANHWTGELLRQVREARGVSLQQLAERTRVTRHHLENIEAERWKALPAPVYLRGILMALARELRLDGQRVARSYLGRAGGGELIEPPGRR